MDWAQLYPFLNISIAVVDLSKSGTFLSQRPKTNGISLLQWHIDFGQLYSVSDVRWLERDKTRLLPLVETGGSVFQGFRKFKTDLQWALVLGQGENFDHHVGEFDALALGHGVGQSAVKPVEGVGDEAALGFDFQRALIGTRNGQVRRQSGGEDPDCVRGSDGTVVAEERQITVKGSGGLTKTSVLPSKSISRESSRIGRSSVTSSILSTPWLWEGRISGAMMKWTKIKM